MLDLEFDGTESKRPTGEEMHQFIMDKVKYKPVVHYSCRIVSGLSATRKTGSQASHVPLTESEPPASTRQYSSRRFLFRVDHRRNSPRFTVSPPEENGRTSSALPCRGSWCSYPHCWKVFRWTSLARLESWLWCRTNR